MEASASSLLEAVQKSILKPSMAPLKRVCASAPRIFLNGNTLVLHGDVSSLLMGLYEKEERFIPSLIQKLLGQDSFHCTAEAHVRDFLFIEDVAEAFAALVESTIIGTVDIGSGKGTRMGDLALQIARQLDKEAKLTFSSSS